ncbi:uncharacterized protein LOC143911153 [Arctopsyche grandis]|uniref:uncharacterized protein LOC143911153 n=1 Tax=Arctopsyche grandis TaxID=121162 RepID=UPI00406D73F8
MRWRTSRPESISFFDELLSKFKHHELYAISFSIGSILVVTLLWLLRKLYKFYNNKKNGPSSKQLVTKTPTEETTSIADEHLPSYFQDRILMKLHYMAHKSVDKPRYVQECIKVLEQHPSAVNHQLPPHGYTPFLRACVVGCLDLVHYMDKNGADLNMCNAYGDSPVYLAAYAVISNKNSNFETLQYLIDAGCPVNVPRCDGNTILHLAARYGHNELVRWLLIRGADPEPTSSLYSAYEYALKYGHESTANLLRININDS